jgi:hypothetical protein
VAVVGLALAFKWADPFGWLPAGATERGAGLASEEFPPTIELATAVSEAAWKCGWEINEEPKHTINIWSFI